MPFKPGQPRPPGAGRVKGVPNKSTIQMKNAILASFERVGGEDYLVEVAKSDPRTYLSFVGRVVPTELLAEVTAAVDHQISFTTMYESAPTLDALTTDLLIPTIERTLIEADSDLDDEE
jgi:hypothetical protein